MSSAERVDQVIAERRAAEAAAERTAVAAELANAEARERAERVDQAQQEKRRQRIVALRREALKLAEESADLGHRMAAVTGRRLEVYAELRKEIAEYGDPVPTFLIDRDARDNLSWQIGACMIPATGRSFGAINWLVAPFSKPGDDYVAKERARLDKILAPIAVVGKVEVPAETAPDPLDDRFEVGERLALDDGGWITRVASGWEAADSTGRDCGIHRTRAAAEVAARKKG